MTALFLALAGLAVQAATPQASSQADSAAGLRTAARQAEVRYERLVRRTAPVRMGGFDGSSCDEIVGRFCVRYDAPGDPPLPSGPEPPELTDARRAAIEALRAAFSLLPGDFDTAAPLVRYLIEDHRPDEAIPAAGLYAAVSADSVRGPLLEGFALHAAARTKDALASFAAALARMPERERERYDRLDWLLERDDRKAYSDLDSVARQHFERRFWRFSDPLYLTPGNEALAEHLARHVWSRILEDAPVVYGMQSWGSDLEQLTVRFGMPVARTRIPGRVGADESIVDHFDPNQLAYTPESVSAGVPPTPLPGHPWELDRKRTRAGYEARIASAVHYLPHQVSRFPGPEGTRIRFDAAFADSLFDGADPVETGFWLLDTVGSEVDRRIRRVPAGSDTVRFSVETDAGPGQWVYALEVLDSADEVAGRARYSVDIDSIRTGPALSDPVILRPFRGTPRPGTRSDPAFQPVADLTFALRDTIGVWVEATGLTAGNEASLRLSLQPASRANLPSRVLGWIGRRIGLASPHEPVFVEWTARADAEGRIRFAFELPPQEIDAGNHVLVARLTETGHDDAVESRRVIRYVDRPR